MNERPKPSSWLVGTLVILCIGAVVAAVLLVGPPSSSQATITRTAKVAQGVVQSTVSGSGNLEPASQLNLGFKTSGTVNALYVHVGEHVVQGQLLATLEPASAEVTLEQARASLSSAEATLVRQQETDGAGTSTGAGASADASAASVGSGTPATGEETAPSSATAKPETGRKKSATPSKSGSSSSPASSPTGTSTESESQTTLSAAAREANLASAKAAVSSARLTVRSDEEALQDTRLYAPESGTIVSLDGQVGEVVSASGTTRASTAASASSSTAASAATTGSGASRTGASATGSTGASDSSSSAFAVLSDLSSMQLVVPLSEAEVGNVKPGQVATVTVEALEGRKLAAHVKEVAILATSSSGVVSYDVTFQLDQTTEGVRPGMSATAEAVVKQAEGLNVPSSAVTDGLVTVVRNGKDVRQRVVTGLSGDSTTIILSGLSAGETVLLPSISTTTSTSTGTSGAFRRTGALGGGIGGGLGAGAFFRGGG